MTANVTENSVKQEQIVKNVVFIFSFLLLELPDSEKIDKGLKSQSVVTLMSWILTLRTYVDVCTSDSHIFGKVPSTKVQRIICCLLSIGECSSCFSTDLTIFFSSRVNISSVFPYFFSQSTTSFHQSQVNPVISLI